MSNASVGTAAAGVERDEDDVISISSIKDMSRELKAQMYEVFSTHKKVCRAYNHLLQQQEQGEEVIKDLTVLDGQDKPKHKWTVRKGGTPPSNDSSACTNDDLASELAELRKKVAKQELQISELTRTVDHLSTVCSAKKPSGYVERTAKRTVEVALPSSSYTNGSRYPKRQRASSVRSTSYHDKPSKSPSRSLTPSPTKLASTTEPSSRKRSRPLQKTASPPPSSSRSPIKRSSFLAAMSTKMLATDESESDESYELPMNAANGEVSEDEKDESGSDSASIASVTVKSSSKRERARSASSELGVQAPRTSSSVTAASQNGSSNGWRSNATGRYV